MKNSVIVFFVVMFFSFSVHAQEPELILGKWVFKEAFNGERIDAAGLEFMNSEIVNKMTFEFNVNGRFEIYAMGEEVAGDWKISEDSKRILLNGFEGGLTELVILNLTENEMALKLGLGEFLMIKSED